MIVKIPKWSPGTHTLFPDNHKRTIIQLLCYANREGTLFSLLPQEVFFQIIEDMEWSDFPDKDMKKNKITIYNVKGGECFDVMWGEGAKVIKKEKVNQMKQEKKRNNIDQLWIESLSNDSKLKYPQWSPKNTFYILPATVCEPAWPKTSKPQKKLTFGSDRKPNHSPQWSPKTHTLFPLHMKNIIIQLSCYFNQEDTIFSILPQEVFFKILENLTWVDFPDEITSKNVITVYQKNGEKNVIKW